MALGRLSHCRAWWVYNMLGGGLAGWNRPMLGFIDGGVNWLGMNPTLYLLSSFCLDWISLASLNFPLSNMDWLKKKRRQNNFSRSLLCFWS